MHACTRGTAPSPPTSTDGNGSHTTPRADPCLPTPALPGPALVNLISLARLAWSRLVRWARILRTPGSRGSSSARNTHTHTNLPATHLNPARRDSVTYLMSVDRGVVGDGRRGSASCIIFYRTCIVSHSFGLFIFSCSALQIQHERERERGVAGRTLLFSALQIILACLFFFLLFSGSRQGFFGDMDGYLAPRCYAIQDALGFGIWDWAVWGGNWLFDFLGYHCTALHYTALHNCSCVRGLIDENERQTLS